MPYLAQALLLLSSQACSGLHIGCTLISFQKEDHSSNGRTGSLFETQSLHLGFLHTCLSLSAGRCSLMGLFQEMKLRRGLIAELELATVTEHRIAGSQVPAAFLHSSLICSLRHFSSCLQLQGAFLRVIGRRAGSQCRPWQRAVQPTLGTGCLRRWEFVNA
jgi:hypothetical protein